MAAWDWEAWRLEIERDCDLRLRGISPRKWKWKPANFRVGLQESLFQSGFKKWKLDSQIEKRTAGECGEENVSSEGDMKNLWGHLSKNEHWIDILCLTFPATSGTQGHHVWEWEQECTIEITSSWFQQIPCQDGATKKECRKALTKELNSHLCCNIIVLWK